MKVPVQDWITLWLEFLVKAPDGNDQEHMAEKTSLHELGGRKKRRGRDRGRKEETENIPGALNLPWRHTTVT